MSDARLRLMLEAMARAPAEVMPSRFWEEMNSKNLRQLAERGYGDFKRTIATNYFTWLLGVQDPQVRFLVGHLPIPATIRCALESALIGRHPPFTLYQSHMYNFTTLMLWQYASGLDREEILHPLEEPREGNPPVVRRRGKVISQDLANSALEIMSLLEGGALREGTRTIIELGAGYGRTAYAILKLRPTVRYLIADIPPALYVCERYLTSQFAERGIFKFRNFSHYAEIEDDLDGAKIAFFLPHQLQLLPPKMADLFINISSLHEMRTDQIAYFLGEMDRLTRGCVYLKQWKLSVLPADGLVIRESDYPIPGSWRTVFWRNCRVQTHFFEALLET